MGGGKTTSTTTVTQTPEEKEYTRQQIELAKQQLALTQEQHGWQSEIYAITKPLLEKYGLMIEDEFARYNTPEAAALRDRYAQLESAQLDAQIRNLPVQEELLQLQLDEIRRGGRATPEQAALIAEITNRAIETGDTDISRFLDQGFTQLREELAPARGLRPTDSPMLDAGGEVLEEALRQKGQLTSQMRGAQANAELNFPLNASQVFAQQNQWQQNFGASMNQFLAGQRQTAEQNRSALMGQLFTAPMAAGEQGLGLINASRPNQVSFPRNTTTTEKSSGSILGGIGGLLSGIGSVAGLFSSEKVKENVEPIQAPEGHVLSPGKLKQNFRQIGDRGPSRYPGNNIRMQAEYDNRVTRPKYGSTTEPGQETFRDGTTIYTLPPGIARPSHPKWGYVYEGQWPKVKDASGNLVPYKSLHPEYRGKWDLPNTGLNAQQQEEFIRSGGKNLPPGHVLSPGALKQNFRPIGLGFAQSMTESGGAPVDTMWRGAPSKPPGPDVTFDPPRPDSHGGPKPPGPDFQVGPPQTDEDALDRIANLPVSSWNYKPEVGLGTQTHIGPMAEDFNTQIMGKGADPTISVVDSLGALTSAVKALDKRTRKPFPKRNTVQRNDYWGMQNDPRATLKKKKFAMAGY